MTEECNMDECLSANDAVGVKERLEFNQDFKLDWHDPDEATDGYQLKWIGKDYARLQAGTAPTTVIIPDSKHNKKNKDSENIFLTGDNLEVLKHLQNAYREAIKMIYIDPPYNTGSDGFVYSDKFEFSDEQLKDMLGLTDDEVKRLHTINGRSSHSAWLTFMYPRLRLARNLLSNDGVIFISVDDNEQSNLKILCDEVFGEDNFAACLVWHNASRQSNLIANEHEYCLVYAKTLSQIDSWTKPREESLYIEQFLQNLKEQGFSQEEAQRVLSKKIDDMMKENSVIERSWMGNYKNLDMDFRAYYPVDLTGEGQGDARMFKGQLVAPPVGRHWMGQDYIDELEKNNRIIWRDGRAYRKLLITESDENMKGIIKIPTRKGSEGLKKLMNGKDVFTKPKPVEFLCHIFKYILKKNDIVLDFFAGSGTTAHAVMQMNKEYGESWQWILCTLDEPCKQGSEAYKSGYKTIDEISRKRIELAAKQLNDTRGFKHFYVQEPSVQTIDKITEFNPEDRILIADDMVAEFNSDKAKGEDIILTTWLTADGYKLNDKVQELNIAGFKAYYMDNSILYIISTGWGTEQTKELLNLVGERKINLNTIILYGYSFDLESMREFEIDVKQSLNNSVEIQKRY